MPRLSAIQALICDITLDGNGRERPWKHAVAGHEFIDPGSCIKPAIGRPAGRRAIRRRHTSRMVRLRIFSESRFHS
ncbi:hypothetical protein [Burkholderia stagnalis]|uniref:hypothetical protein n=1 Tax=Burkholderia stagnalis TaxID=1503054 RepID=UPI00158ECB87|nr:hypothetical protein [Burkholderia stagnalis]